MNVLFLTVSNITNLEDKAIYEDLLREFHANGHNVFVASPNTKKTAKKSQVIKCKHGTIIKIKTGSLQKTNFITKGISTIRLENQYIKVLKKELKDQKIDLVLYATPPITLVKVIKYFKKRDNAFAYLMLKDIFPQNSVDIGLLSKRGLKGIIYKFFRNKEKKLYEISDKIGCMSKANCDYILANNPEIDEDKVEICPNSAEIIDLRKSKQEKDAIREKLNLPKDKKLFVYGGNLGRPQSIPHLIKCIQEAKNDRNAFFVIVGSGTEDYLMRTLYRSKVKNFKYFGELPKTEYDTLISCCDVGIIMLDYRFTIPNFPSRMLTYMKAGLPVLACTDETSDIGKVIVENQFGWWCPSNSVCEFIHLVKNYLEADSQKIEELSQNSFECLCKLYGSKDVYRLIEKSLK